MSKLLILCVETTKQKKLDNVYIDKTIKSLYEVGCDVSLKYCYFYGKGNYNKKDIKQQIKELEDMALTDEKQVVYFIDLDSYDIDSSIKKKNEEIENYCIKKGYKLVWFCRNIEEVFWHKKIGESEKTQYAKNFNVGKTLQMATKDSLSSESKTKNKSNLMLVFNNLLKKKQ